MVPYYVFISRFAFFLPIRFFGYLIPGHFRRTKLTRFFSQFTLINCTLLKCNVKSRTFRSLQVNLKPVIKVYKYIFLVIAILSSHPLIFTFDTVHPLNVIKAGCRASDIPNVLRKQEKRDINKPILKIK